MMISKDDLEKVKIIRKANSEFLEEMQSLGNEKLVGIPTVKKGLGACFNTIDYLTKLILEEKENV